MECPLDSPMNRHESAGYNYIKKVLLLFGRTYCCEVMNNLKKRLLIFLLFLCLGIGHSCYAQFSNLKFDHITAEQGLPQSTIHGITKDKYGFMWFGTWSGLCRYDGYKIKVYRYDANNPKSIINNRIHNIVLDDKQDMYIRTFDNKFICRYNYETDDFERIPEDQVSDELNHKIARRRHINTVNYTFRDYKWHLDTYNNTIIETHLPSGKTSSYAPNPVNTWSINDAYITDMYLDDQDILWLGTYSNGVNKTNLRSNPFQHWYHDPNNRNSIIEQTIRSICEDQDGNVWVGTRSQGISIRMRNGTFKHFQEQPRGTGGLSSNYIKKLFCDSKGRIWIGTMRGLDYYDKSSHTIKHFVIPSLENTGVYGFAEDRNQNIWLATWKGIFKYDRQTDKIIHFDNSPGIPSRFIWTLFLDDKNQIWAGTEGEGIYILRETRNKLEKVYHLTHDTTNTNSISDDRIYSIFKDKNNHIWIGTGNGLDRYNPISNTVTRLSDSPQGLPKGAISGITADNRNNVWISHKRGISRIDIQNNAIRNFSKQNGLQSNEFSDGAIYKSTSQNLLYFGGNNGINIFCPDSIQVDLTPPKIVLTELQILNEPVQVNTPVNDRILLKHPLHLSKSLDLIHEDKSIAIEFAALHYTNPEGNKYAYMLEGFDKDWIYTDYQHRVATYSNLAPGNYTFKVKASNSDGIWNDEPATLAIHVSPAWWASTWAYLVYTILFISALIGTYYYLVRYDRLKNKLAYEALLHEKERELHQSKVQFFTNISHEIKTPLTLILSPIQQLRQLAADIPVIQQYTQTMQKNGNRLLKIVNQLLDIRRLESGHEVLQVSPADIIAFTKGLVDSFWELADTKHIDLVFIADTDTLLCSFDQDKLEKIMNNLLSNAFKFTPDRGQVTVNISTTAAYISIAVIDNGRGISEEELKDIFIPFKQTKHNNESGTGLGLTYTKSLVELHGGTITANSRRDTAGNRTEFHVTLPVHTDKLTSPTADVLIATEQLPAEVIATETQAGERTPDLSYLSTEKATILIAEDNPEMREYLVNYFEPHYHILEAPDGKTGLELVHKNMPDLVISDVMMPNMDGITFCSTLKSDILAAHIPVILLTARSLPEYEMEGLKIGADDYITKPFNIDLLGLKVKNQILNRIRLQEKFRLKVAVSPTEIDVQSPDEKLIQKILQYVEDNISDTDLKIDTVCESIGLSRAQLYRKMKALTGYSMADMIREVRLKRAQQLLRDKKFNISEITYMVGFSDTDYFRKAFKAKFGQSPTEYARQYS